MINVDRIMYTKPVQDAVLEVPKCEDRMLYFKAHSIIYNSTLNVVEPFRNLIFDELVTREF